jgi:hypothetical protein
MSVEEQRYIHEDLERLEQGIADRISYEPREVQFSHSNLLASLHIETDLLTALDYRSATA